MEDVKLPEVLFVDDESNILKSLTRLFLDEDITVHTADSGSAGLEILKGEHDIGLIVSDQRMPGLSGVDFLEEASRLCPDAKRVLLTGYSDVNASIDAINRAKASRYITKPWQDEELVQVVKGLLRQVSLERENEHLQEVINQKNEELKKWNSQLEYYVQEQTIELQNNNAELRKLNKQQRQAFKGMIMAFSGLIEMRDTRVRSHSKNVAELTVRIARELNVAGKELETLTVAALLHDLGKIGIPDLILVKEEKDLSADEVNEYKLHVVRGQTALDEVVELRPAGILIRHHHERFDGQGYPDGLVGRDIPLGARIMAVADFADNSIGRHLSEKTIDNTLREIKVNLNMRFDPEIYPAALKVIKPYYLEQLHLQGVEEKEILPWALQAGMVLSREVYSGTGLLLLNRGVELDDEKIKTLKRYYALDPSQKGIFVWLEHK